MMEAEVVDCNALGEAAVSYHCAYVVLREAQETIGDLTASGYELKGTISGYQVYYNDEVFHDL